MEKNNDLPIQVRRRADLIDRLIDLILPNIDMRFYCGGDVDDFIEKVISEVRWLKFEEEFGIQLINLKEIKKYIIEHKSEYLSQYFENKCNNKLQEQISRIKSMMGLVTETRQGMFRWLKEKLPNTPEYVIRDWVYKMLTQSDDVNTYEGMTEWVDEWVSDLEWISETNFLMTMDIFTEKTRNQLEKRMGGELITHVEKDEERHQKQKELLQSRGISEEPIILFQTKDGKYELGEGWHRTTQNFLQHPKGFIQPNVYIGLNAKWLDPDFKPLS
jgi:hypothetical protein